MRNANEALLLITAEPPKSVLILIDITIAAVTRESVSRAKEVTVLNRPYVKRAALVGAESLSNAFYEAIKIFPAGISAIQHPRRGARLAGCRRAPCRFIVCFASQMHRRTAPQTVNPRSFSFLNPQLPFPLCRARDPRIFSRSPSSDLDIFERVTTIHDHRCLDRVAGLYPCECASVLHPVIHHH